MRGDRLCPDPHERGTPEGSPYSTVRAEQLRAAASAVRFEEALSVAAELPRLHSLLVSRRGELLLERYYNGARATRPANVKSAAKSIISALVGIAIDRRLIPGVETPIVTYFPELREGSRSRASDRSRSKIC